MGIEHHPLTKEFPDHHETIHQLKTGNAHFSRLMEEYETMDKEVFRMEENIETVDDDVLNEHKKRRLALKDEIADMIHGAEG